MAEKGIDYRNLVVPPLAGVKKDYIYYFKSQDKSISLKNALRLRCGLVVRCQIILSTVIRVGFPTSYSDYTHRSTAATVLQLESFLLKHMRILDTKTISAVSQDYWAILGMSLN